MWVLKRALRMGASLVEMAKKCTGEDFIGIEVHFRQVSQTVMLAKERGYY